MIYLHHLTRSLSTTSYSLTSPPGRNSPVVAVVCCVQRYQVGDAYDRVVGRRHRHEKKERQHITDRTKPCTEFFVCIYISWCSIFTNALYSTNPQEKDARKKYQVKKPGSNNFLQIRHKHRYSLLTFFSSVPSI